MRALGTWVLMAVAMIANGIFRAMVLAPWLGHRAGEIVSVALAITLILLITRPMMRSMAVVSAAECGGLGAMWVALTIAFEFVFGHWIGGASWASLLAAYDVTSGSLWPLILAVLALSPWIWRPRGLPRLAHA